MFNTHTAQAPTQDMTLEQVRVAMHQLLADESCHHYRMGQLYNYVVDSGLAQKAGHKTSLDYFSQHVSEVPRSTLLAYGAVAREFSEGTCARFGITRLKLLLTYEEAAGIEVNRDEPADTVIQVPDDDGAVTSRLFTECSVDNLRKSLRRLRKPRSSKPLPAEARALGEQYREALVDRFPLGSRVQVRLRNLKGEAVISFQDIPLTHVQVLSEALREQPRGAQPAVFEARCDEGEHADLEGNPLLEVALPENCNGSATAHGEPLRTLLLTLPECVKRMHACQGMPWHDSSRWLNMENGDIMRHQLKSFVVMVSFALTSVLASCGTEEPLKNPQSPELPQSSESAQDTKENVSAMGTIYCGTVTCPNSTSDYYCSDTQKCLAAVGTCGGVNPVRPVTYGCVTGGCVGTQVACGSHFCCGTGTVCNTTTQTCEKP